MDQDDNALNIYSEAFFPSTEWTQSTSTSASGLTPFTQTQKSQGKSDDEAEDDDDSDLSSTDIRFRLENVGCKGSKLKQDYCTTGCHLLDEVLSGGMPTFGITEVFGEAGSGKTQLCLQLALTAQLPVELGGLDAGGYYHKLMDFSICNNLLIHQFTSVVRRVLHLYRGGSTHQTVSRVGSAIKGKVWGSAAGKSYV